MTFSHLNQKGRGRMVSLKDKADSLRTAQARGFIEISPEILKTIKEGQVSKGDVLAIAQIAGISAAKKTWDLIPLCHTILLRGVDLDFDIQEDGIEVSSRIETIGPTGAEMEALTAVSVSLLTIYDMCKGQDKAMIIRDIRLMAKTGGKSGDYHRE